MYKSFGLTLSDRSLMIRSFYGMVVDETINPTAKTFHLEKQFQMVKWEAVSLRKDQDEWCRWITKLEKENLEWYNRDVLTCQVSSKLSKFY